MNAAAGKDKPAWATGIAGLLVALLLLKELNFPTLTPQTSLALFLALGLVWAFFLDPRIGKQALGWRIAGWTLGALGILGCLRVGVMSDQAWLNVFGGGEVLGKRVGIEQPLDTATGLVIVVAVLEGSRRLVGWPLTVLALITMAYALLGPWLPDGLLPHRGTSPERLSHQLGLHAQGVFGVAFSVMFTHVALFILLGVLLQQTGAIAFLIGVANRWFGRTPGGVAKVAVVGSGLMGSLSGSAVANTAATGAFSIPMMRASGFRGVQAAAIEAVASSGGAMVPPVMGAAAYLMLEIVQPPVTLVTVMKAAIVPSFLYYLSLFLIVDLTARREGKEVAESPDPTAALPGESRTGWTAGLIFLAGLTTLVGLLLAKFTPSRSASVACVVTIVLAATLPGSRLDWRGLLGIAGRFLRDVSPLLVAAACAGIVVGVLTMTGAGTRLASLIAPLTEQSLGAAFVALMVISLILGLGLPPLVCYLLLTTLIGSVIANLGVPPLAAHFFIFYFGMLSMITPPVALAAYAAAGIAGVSPMAAGFQAFRFGWITFLIPYQFVFRPELLLLDLTLATLPLALWSLLTATAGIAIFAAGTTRYALRTLERWECVVAFIAATLLILPPPAWSLAGPVPVLDVGALLAAAVVALRPVRRHRI